MKRVTLAGIIVVMCSLFLMVGILPFNKALHLNSFHGEKRKHNEVNPADNPSDVPNTIAPGLEREVADHQVRPIADLRREIGQAFKTSEAARARMLLEKRYANAEGYILGVETPTPQEVKEIRKKISETLAQAPKSERQELDKWIGQMIKLYDPFGDYGRKIIFIRIPDSATDRITGMTYSAEDFNAEVEKFKSPIAQKERRRNLIHTTADANGQIDRFDALIKMNPPE